MTTPAPLPLSAAMQGVLANLPPGTTADELKVAQDWGTALIAEGDAYIDANGPHTILIGGAERAVMKDILKTVVTNSLAALQGAAIPKG